MPAGTAAVTPTRASGLQAVLRADLYHVNGYFNKEIGTLAKTQGHVKRIR